MAPTDELRLDDGRLLRYCLYGQEDGWPVIVHGGSPSTRWRRPLQIAAMERSGLRFLVYDRPGYGGSTRAPGRTVTDAAADVRQLADAHDWERFGVFGGSGGAPHALACAALLGDRVTRCALHSATKPAEAGTVPRDDAEVRSTLTDVAAEILAKIDAGGPEIPGEPGGPANQDPDAMARIRATFVDGTDGWVDDFVAFSRPWGFDPGTITVPIGIWRGTDDVYLSVDHHEWLLAHLPTGQGHLYAGGHLPGPSTLDEIFAWLQVA